ncbi:tetratricopeptide repeat domain-containing protein [Ditylenchus destructor]|uniref:Tetratricopeptide repeat domain-containing protein n=1 Tax=Ditylenchus destructor TaxID=166010 RepID=A0AAD4MZ90_9BILA|nr:tetratricopeptide repeat domain-containing protein [Ditylenchus destructor]
MTDQNMVCRRLAREGEKATRMGDAPKGIEFLEEALAVGIDDIQDLPLLSAIYSQLGNAYYAQKLYRKALTFHSNDLMLSRVQKDCVQQAKAYSNMSATYTMLNEFDQAMSCADNVVCLARKLNDRGLECRGLYNLGLAHLQNAIQGTTNISEGTEEMVAHLHEAVSCFELHLEIAKERKDEILCGLAIGNLGNAYFYLGEYDQSIVYHLKRLEIARSVGDKSSMRRSYTNMANAYVLLGNHKEAAKCYKHALSIAQDTNRRNLEAQLLFSMGNVESLRKNYREAVAHYLQHLRLARALNDQAGECRANSSLANALTQLNEPRKALYFLVINYKQSEKLGDESMKRSTLEEIKRLMKFNPSAVLSQDDDRICLDASFDPDNLSVVHDGGNEIDFDPIVDDSGNPNQHHNHLNVPSDSNRQALNNPSSAFSMPNLSMSLSLESFIRECARASSSTPKKGSLIPMSSTGSVLPTPKNTGTENDGSFMSTDCGLTRDAICKSMPDMEANEGWSRESFFDCLERVQGNRINEQRADPGILKDRTNEERQSDNLRGTSASRRMSLGAFKSMGSHFRKAVFKPLSSGLSASSLLHRSGRNRPHSFYGTLPHSNSTDNAKSERSTKQIKKTQKQQLSKSKSLSGVQRHQKLEELEEIEESSGNSKNAAKSGTPVFRVPQLPVQRHGMAMGNSGVLQRVKSAHTPSNATSSERSSTMGSVKSSSQRWRSHREELSEQQNNTEIQLLDLIESIQSRRMDEQRADLVLPGLNNPIQLLEKFNLGHRHNDAECVDVGSLSGEDLVDERLYELIMQSQSDRIEDQRGELGGGKNKKRSSSACTVEEDEDDDDGGITELVQRMNRGREAMSEQRAAFSPSRLQQNENNSPSRSENKESLAFA